MAEQKNILVVVPVNEAQKARLEAAVEGGAYECHFTYMPTKPAAEQDVPQGGNVSLELMREVAEEDLTGQHVIIGAVAPKMLHAADALEWLQLSWAGADSFCSTEVLPANVVLTNARGAYGLSCSEHLLAQTFALIRNIPEYVRSQTKHAWQQNPHVSAIEGSVVVSLGLGDIGGDYARKMKALGAYVIGVRRNATVVPDYCDEVVSLDELDTVLPRADIVANSLPGGRATEGLLNEARLRAMKPGAFFINVGRGNVLDQEAAKRVLDAGHLGGMALDVFAEEPLPADDALWDNERVLITPHVAGQFFLEETLVRMLDIAKTNLHAWSHGLDMCNVVDRELGY